ncbi:MAG: hypothetical protein JSV66_12615 [Trueperaceae bacterium]|nr:MAG: hypothetical protein JSV66_12615 [Trueperaceae bacterium]
MASSVRCVSLIPLMGPFHLHYPLYNAVSVRDTVKAFTPDGLATTALNPGAFANPGWQDTPELALPLSVVPWARSHGLALEAVGEPSPDPTASTDFVRYLREYAGERNLLSEIEGAGRAVEALLGEALTLERIFDELLPAVRSYHELREDRFGDGPGTDWLRARANAMAERILALPGRRLAVLAGVDELPFLQDALGDQIERVVPPQVSLSEAARRRGLLDFAFRLDVSEPGNVIAQLRELNNAEARYLEANLLFANGHAAEALELLEQTSQGDFSSPYYLPGYLLARLGQLRDLASDRSGALRAYRGVQALEYAPPEAREAAERGLEEPFKVMSNA